MGKKRIISQTEEELIKEGEKTEKKEAKAVKKEEAAVVTKQIREGQVYISSTYNNTIITLSDQKGNVLGWKSAGSIGFKGSKKSTPFAASKVAETVALLAQKFGIEKIDVFVRGVGSGRESAIRSFAARGLEINSIRDLTPIPHNGCRPCKVRRV
jgi:small subunit ribosomal protein S11